MRNCQHGVEMKITNQEVAELFKSALVAYENEPNKGKGPDGYCYDTLAGGRVAIQMAAKILLQPPPDRPQYDYREITAFLRERLESVLAPKDPAVEAVRKWLLRKSLADLPEHASEDLVQSG